MVYTTNQYADLVQDGEVSYAEFAAWCLGDVTLDLTGLRPLLTSELGGFLQGYPKMDDLQGKIPRKWVIWVSPYFRKPPFVRFYIYLHLEVSINGVFHHLRMDFT